jgi:MoxR-like ATPase
VAKERIRRFIKTVVEERQVTVMGRIPSSLPDPFIVLATQNPVEQEGTYPLPEAQLDRFLFKDKARACIIC